jgi:TolB protein
MVCALSIVMAMGVGAAWPQTSGLGIFTNEGSVGQTPPGGKAQYDAAKGEYRITGGGANMWGAVDAFYFVWKKASGDVSLSADIQWVGTSAAEHRKAVLIVRQSLDPGSPYADVVSHGNGLTSLQFRGAVGEQTYQIVAAEDGPSRLRIVKKGSRFTMYFGKPGEELKSSGPVEFVTVQEPFYVGLGVCSHVATTLETAIFSNVKLEETAAAK